MQESALYSYLQKLHPERSYLKIRNLTDITSGWETKIYSFDSEYTYSGNRVNEQLILRMYPGPHGYYNSKKEFIVLRHLNDVGYPVPIVHHVEQESDQLGLPFIIMDRITGSSLDDHMKNPKEFDTSLTLFCEFFSELHRLDWKDMLTDSKQAELGEPSSNIKNALLRRKERIHEHERQELLPILEWLDTRVSSIKSTKISITHNDFHPMNILLDSSNSPYVIDWTATDITDYRVDLAWTLLLAGTYWNQSYRDSILLKYEEISGNTVSDIEFFEVFAILRRIFDISVSFSKGASELGMREDATEVMKESLSHMRNVSSLLQEYTGLVIPEFEQLLDDIQSQS